MASVATILDGTATEEEIEESKGFILIEQTGFEHLYLSNVQSIPPITDQVVWLEIDNSNIDIVLEDLPDSITSISVDDCKSLTIKSFPPDLRRLRIYNTPISHLPDFPLSLHSLCLCHLPDITSIPALPPKLQDFRILGLPSLSRIPKLPSSIKEFQCRETNVSVLPPLPARIWGFDVLDSPVLITRKKGESIAGYEVRWAAIREQIKMQRVKERLAKYKEDLMIFTWHPERYWGWCIDEEEKAEWAQYDAWVQAWYHGSKIDGCALTGQSPVRDSPYKITAC